MNFFDFLDSSVTPFHTVKSLSQMFSAGKFERADKVPSYLGGKSFFVRRGCALVAVRFPENFTDKSRFRIALAHTDFPALKIAPNPEQISCDTLTLHTEVYGSPLYVSWLDRDLCYAGMVAYEKDGSVQTKLVRGEKLLRIPQLAIHLNRNVNGEGLKVNPQEDFDAMFASACHERAFTEALQGMLPRGSRMLDFDIQLFDSEKATFGGFHDEWIYSGRLDNLSSCHAIASAMVSAVPAENDIQVAAFFNNEEVGSVSLDGAAGNLLMSVLSQVWNKLTKSQVSFEESLSESFALSIDMAHAVHPNHPEKHDANHAPVLGGGVVLKMNAGKRYASDLLGSARFRLLCEQALVPYQVFIMRNDMPCGSTVGPTVSAKLGIPTVDIGEPMLSMHSIREQISVADHDSMTCLIAKMYEMR